MSRNIIFFFVTLLAINGFIVVISMWRIFEKAHRPGWGVLVPFYNIYLFVKTSGKPSWWFWAYILWGCLPVLGIFGILGLAINSSISLAKRFGKGTLFGYGMVFLSFICLPILAFGNATYTELPREDELPITKKDIPKKQLYPPNQPSYEQYPNESSSMNQPYPNQRSFEYPPYPQQPVSQNRMIEKPQQRAVQTRPEIQQTYQQQPMFRQPISEQPISEQPISEQPIRQRNIVERPFERVIRQRPIRQPTIIERPLMEEPVKKPNPSKPLPQNRDMRKPPEKKESKWDRLL